MATQVQFRRGNTAQTAVFTGAVAEITVDTEQKTIVVHDGVTLGGNYLSTKAFTQQVYNYANTIAGGGATDNVARALAQNAYNTANGANGLAQGAYNQANTNSGAITIIQGVDSTQNTRLGSIETINTDQNTSISIIQGVNSTQNTQIQGLQGVDLATNSAISIIQGVDLGQNTTITAVNQFAQAAYNTANNKFNSSGGTISGDVAVTGNLTVTGETFYANVTNLNVDDSFIVLNANTVGSPVFNGGIEIDRGTSNNTLLFWNESSETWNYTDNLSNNFTIASESYVTNSVSQVNNFAQSSYNQANSANSLANTAYTTALGANGLAAGAYNLANTSIQNSGTQTLNGNLIINGSSDTTGWSNTANAYVSNKLYAGIAPYIATPLANLIAQFTGNVASYVQVNAENINPQGTTDYVATADVGTDTTFYIDLGIENSQAGEGVYSPLDGYLIVQGNTGQIGGNLIIGTTSQTPGQHTKIIAGGEDESNVVIQFNDDLSTIFYGNALPSVTNSQYLGSSTKRWHSVYVGPGSVNIDNIVLSNNNGQLVITGASDFVISGSSVPSTGDISNKANNAYDRANAAFASSNSVNQFAASAFSTANGANGLAAGAYNQANTGTSIAQSAYNFANTLSGGSATDNVARTLAQSAYNSSNLVNQFAQSAFNTANGANGLAAGAYNQANTNAGAITIIQGVNNTQNTNITSVNNFAAGAYNQANTNAGVITIIQGVDNTQNNDIIAVNNYAQSAFALANTNATNITAVNGFAQSAFNTANGANGLANGAYAHANSAYSYTTQVEAIALNAYNKANSAFDSSNAVNGFAISAFNKANSANILAQAAFDTANLKFNTSGGNINGDVTITANNDLTVTGNLYVLGNTTSFGTQTLEVVDPMILLATGNYSTDLLDIGFSGSYNDGANAHTGLFRDATGNKDWYFFEGYTPEVSGNNNIVIADPSFRTSNVNVNYLKSTGVFSPVIYSTGATTKLELSDIGLVGITVAGQTYQFGASGIESNQGVFGGSFGGNRLSLNNETNLISNRYDTVKIQTGTTGTVVNEFVFANNAVTLPGALIQTNAARITNTFTTSSNTQVAVDSFSASTYRSAKYEVQVTSGTDYHVIELRVVHDGTTTYLAQYGEILTSSSLGTFDTDISGGNVRLLFTGVNSVSVVKVIREAINI